jgi:hypothetical protein
VAAKVPVFEPASGWRLVWDFVVILNIVFVAFIIPLRICFFGNQDSQLFPVKMEWILFHGLFLLFDVILSLNTAVYDKGQLIKDRSIIFASYIK